jgi:uncharacterized RDD family membrane protein YckC
MTYIGVGRRFVAWLIDSLITGLAWVPFAETESVDGVYSIRWDGIDFIVPLVITLAYFVILEGWLGATIGKVVLGIRVRRPDGGRIGFGAAAIRNVARLVDSFPYVIPYLVGGIAVGRSDMKQRFGDRWAKTVVILVGTDSDAPAPATAMVTTTPDPFGLPTPPSGAPPPSAPPPDAGPGSLPPPPPGT